MSTVVGTPLRRKEDPKLLTGESRYVDDLVVPGALHAAIVRSPYAHARINSVDLSAALAQPGVVAAFSGADLRSEWAGPMPCAWPVTEDMRNPEHLPLAVETACYAGDGVAVVLAETEAQAKDAAEAVAVDYDVLPAVVDLEDALSDRVLVHEALGTNRSYTWELIPNPEAVDAAFANAAHTVTERFVQQRLIPSAIETRGVVAVPSVYGGDFTLYSATQIPHILRVLVALTLGISETKLRVVAPSVGGGFGSKLNVYAEELLCLALARKLGRPVRWTEERMENATATIQGRGMIQHVELAADGDGKVTAVRVRLLADMGAYLQLVSPGIPLLGAFLYGGVYDIPAYSFVCTSVFTTKTPTDAYRGAGRPEATYASWASTRPRSGGATTSRPTSSPTTPRADWSTTAATTSRPWTGPWTWWATSSCARSRRRGGPRGSTSTSASACRPTWRCAAWPRAGCSRPCATSRAAGRRRRCGSCRRARSRSSPAPPPTARATRPPGP
jgi:carbon-monoxide dehydrogenase large subunit